MSNTCLDLAALLRIPYVEPDTGYDISPDGKQIAFSWNKTGQWEIYLLSIDAPAKPIRITGEEGGKFSPKWSPDGRYLAYVCDTDGSERFDIYLYDTVSEQRTNLTPNTEEAIGYNINWSPDSEHIAFCCNRDGTFDTYILQLSSLECIKFFSSPHPHWDNKWSPDGSHLLVEMEGKGQDMWTFIVPLDGSTPYPISVAENPICVKDAVWSPQGDRIAFSSDVHGSFDIGILNLKDHRIFWITHNNQENDQPDWSPDGSTLVYLSGEGPKYSLVLHDTDNDQAKTYQLRPGVMYRPKFNRSGDEVLLIYDNPRRPSDLWRFNLIEQSFHRLTRSLPSEIDPDVFCLPQEIRYPGLDGKMVPALLYQPARSKVTAPAVIYIHGGPNWLAQITWEPMIQHMVSRGWVVLAPNYRGSTGHGREWQNAARYDLGGVDTDDVAAGVHFLVEKNIVDPDRIGVMGRSWGGYLTMTCLINYPELWAAGSAIVPFLNWFTSHANSRDDLKHWDIENFGHPDDNQDLWYDRSPFFYLDEILAPVQLICGAHDIRCPASESEQAYQELIELGKECEFILYPDEGHSFMKTENQIDSQLRCMNFLARRLEINHPEKVKNVTQSENNTPTND